MSYQHKIISHRLLLIKFIKHLSQQARLFSKCNGVYNRSQRWHSSGLKYMFNMVLHLQLLHSSKYSFNTGASVCRRLLLRRQQSVSSPGETNPTLQDDTVQECRPAHFKQWYDWQWNRTVTVAQSTKSLFYSMKLYHQKLQVRQKHKELQTPNSHRHDNLYIF